MSSQPIVAAASCSAAADGAKGASDGRSRQGRSGMLLTFGVTSLLLGWLAPQYVAKFASANFGAFFATQPLVAALVAQAFFSPVLLLPPEIFVRDHSAMAGGAGEERRGLLQRLSQSRAQWASTTRLAVLVFIAHSMWYASFSRTNVATNTLLWNTDVVATPLIAAALSRRAPARREMLGGGVGLLGAGLAMHASESGDSPLGCALCFAASIAYALNAVVAERRNTEEMPVSILLGIEGIVALVATVVVSVGAAIVAPDSLAAAMTALPSFWWLIFIGMCSLMLNLGWLLCAEIAGPFWTAMVACVTIPLTMSIDAVIAEKLPSLISMAGGSLVFLGFLMVSRSPPQEPMAERIRRMLRSVARQSSVLSWLRRWWLGCIPGLSVPLLDGVQDAAGAIVSTKAITDSTAGSAASDSDEFETMADSSSTAEAEMDDDALPV
mmetsp:Transcript_85336/g.246693  ORF Transcript_85336/g.246693 Transcript_85336/m.246693 type:complete len:439 (-) Transcript_85336:106-1422(-)